MMEANKGQTVGKWWNLNSELNDTKAFIYITLEIGICKDITYQWVNSWSIEDTEISHVFLYSVLIIYVF